MPATHDELASDAASTTYREVSLLVSAETRHTHTAALTAWLAVRDEADANLRAWVVRSRTAGFSWTEIGHQLRMTKQAAQQRYGRYC